MHYRSEVARRNYRRVLLAVYWLSDDDGLVCSATGAEIARAAGVSETTAGRHVDAMIRASVVSAFGRLAGFRGRVLVIRDNPKARQTESALMDLELSRMETESRTGAVAIPGTKDIIGG